MSKIKFNEWQEISIKKDIKSISNKMERRSSTVAFIIELFFTVCSIIVSTTDIIPDCHKVWVTIVFLSLLLIVPLLIIFLSPLCKRAWFSYKVKKGKLSYKEQINTFDNEVNQYIMMAYSFYDCIEKDTKPQLTTYYYIQANYYINKCIWHLEIMQNFISDIFSLPLKKGNIENIDNEKISYERLNNLLSLIHMMRSELLNDKKEFISKIDQNEKNNIELECQLYNKKIDNFVFLLNIFLKNHEYEAITWSNLSSPN